MRDILEVMSDKVTVRFKIAADKFVTERGRWCNLCKWAITHKVQIPFFTYDASREDMKFIKLNGTRKAFHMGGNSSCRQHIRQHYALYKERCEKANIPVNHWAIPRSIWNIMEEEKEAAAKGWMMKKQQQQQLNFKTVTGPREFMREGTLQAVAKLIATNNQVSLSFHITDAWLRHTYPQPLALADNAAFQNALVSMRPKSTTSDLPSSHNVQVYLHNKFVKHMKHLKEEITVSFSIPTSYK